MSLNVEIEYEQPTAITSKDIDDTWLFLNNRIILATQGKNLNELFDNQQQVAGVLRLVLDHKLYQKF
jgi:hypothetical protein